MSATRRVLLVFGTRPEAIKMAPVYAALRADASGVEPVCCVTGQHRGLLDRALASFGIVPDIDLDLMREGQLPGELGAAVLASLGPVLDEVAPDLVLVHGDTTTSMASALAAFYAGIPIGHVEAGLRSRSLSAPFPEELNRRVTTLASRYHFAPTSTARDNLLSEGCDPASIHVTGNTAVDAILQVAGRLDADPALATRVARDLGGALGFDWRRERLVLVTCHRRESFGEPLSAICAAIAELAEQFQEVRFVIPVHPNPRVRSQLAERLGRVAGVHLIAPLGYESLVALLRACHFVLTDSGGIQEEAPSFGKPVLIMRQVTERPEAIAAGCARLVGVDRPRIVAEASTLLRDPAALAAMVPGVNPFGDGRAGARIAEVVREGLSDAAAAQPLSYMGLGS